MGTYRQPTTPVDTTSAKAWTDASDKMLGLVATDVANVKARREAAAKRAEANKEIAKKQNDYFNKTGQAINEKVANRGVLFNEESKKQINNSITVAAELVGSGRILTQEEQNYIVNTTKLADTIAGNLTDMASYNEGFSEKLSKMGEMGGLASGNDPAQLNFMVTMFDGGTDSTISFKSDQTASGSAETFYTVKSKEHGDFTFTGSMLSQMSENPSTDMLITIPDETENMTAMMDNNIWGKSETGGDKRLNDIFFANMPKEYGDPLPNGEIPVYKTANKKLVEKALRQDAVANVESLQKNQQLALYEFLQKKLKGDKADAYSLDHVFETEEEQKEFEDALTENYIEYTIDNSNYKYSDRLELGNIPAPDTDGDGDGSGDDDDAPLDPVLTAWIEDLNIETLPLEEGATQTDGGLTTRPAEMVDLDKLEAKLQDKGFNILGQEEIQDDEGKVVRRQFNVKKYNPSRKRDITVTINSGMTASAIKNLLKSIQTNQDVSRIVADEQANKVITRPHEPREQEKPNLP